jgi:hypothetical protein
MPGVCVPGDIDPRTPSGFVESGTIQGLADKHLQGWAWWGYAGLECYDAKGVPIPQYVAMMSRTYAQVRGCQARGRF